MPSFKRNKDNLTIKFGQITDYNMKTVSLKNPKKKGGGTIPRTFSKNIKTEYIFGLIV